MSISDRVAIMRAGRVEQVGTPEEVYARPVSTYVARFIGSPQMDLLQGELVRLGDHAGYQVGSLTFPVPPAILAHLFGVAADMAIRPEHISLDPAGASATVRVVQPLGPMTTVSLAWEGGTLTARLPGMAHLVPGQPVGVGLDPDHLLFFDRASGRRIHPQ